ncbi:cation-transporting ATPase PacS, partial [Xanthomonas citri pv. citri]|nr:cation-transporting ATPase PacS [Xanthomonas citri pv. citri]
RPAFRDTLSNAGFDADQILCLAGSLEQGSEHPLAEAIVAEAQRRGLNLVAAQDFDSLTGQGVRGRVSDQDVVLGNQSL